MPTQIFPIPFPIFQGLSNTGSPLAGGQLFTYAAGTSTPLATYADAEEVTQNANPVVLDANGRAPVFIPAGVGYKFVLEDALGNTIWTEDNIQVPAVPSNPSPSNIPTGGIIAYGAAVAPTGYLLCVAGNTSVCLADGTERRIDDIVERRESVDVLALDEASGEIQSARVTEWFKFSATKRDWFRISIAKGKGFGPRTIDVTKDHPFWTQRGWVRADQLDPSHDRIYRYDETLTDIGRQAVHGMLLGDACVWKGRLSVVHSRTQSAYMAFIALRLDMKVCPVTMKGPLAFGGPGRVALQAVKSVVTSMPDVAALNSKTKARHCARRLTPVGLAFWYMDDGNLQSDKRFPKYARAQLHTEGFRPRDLASLRLALKRLGIETRVYARNNTRGSLLRATKEGSRTLFQLVAPYIHPSMRYKLPEEYRDVPFVLEHAAFLEKRPVPFRFGIRPITSYSRGKRDLLKFATCYDIKVDGRRSFIGNGFVVHNCDGSAVSRTGFAALFAVIGTTFGSGNGSTTFNVPDCRQRFILGLAVSGTGSTLGGTGGAIDHTHSGPSHTHTIAAHTHTITHTHAVPHGGWTTTVEAPPLAGLLQAGGTGSGSETQVTQATADNTTGASSAPNSGSTALTTDAGGTGNTGSANGPFIACPFIIKT